MKLRFACLVALILIVSPLVLRSGTHDYGIANNDLDGPNTATIGEYLDGALMHVSTVRTGGHGSGVGNNSNTASNRVVIVPNGSAQCAFLSDAGTSDIAAFTLSGSHIVRVGNYSNTNFEGGNAIALAAHGSVLFAGYYGSANIGSWAIQSDCSLVLLNLTSLMHFATVNGMGVTPDGQILIVSYGNSSIDSFSIGTAGSLIEHGPYTPVHGDSTIQGLDITAESKAVIFASIDNDTKLDIWEYGIQTDGSLGSYTDYAELTPNVDYCVYPRLSPNEQFIYVSCGVDAHEHNVVTLSFDRSSGTIAYVSTTNLSPQYNAFTSAGQLATISPNGNGDGLYVTLTNPTMSSVALLTINADGTTVETPNSPFFITKYGGPGLSSIAAWPPRPF